MFDSEQEKWVLAQAEKLRTRYHRSPDPAKREAVADLGVLDIRRTIQREGVDAAAKKINAVGKTTEAGDLRPPRPDQGTDEAQANQRVLLRAARDVLRKKRPGTKVPDRPGPVLQREVIDQTNEIRAYAEAPEGLDPASPQNTLIAGVSRDDAAKIPTPYTVRNELDYQRRQLVRMGFPVSRAGERDMSTFDGAMDAQHEINRAVENIKTGEGGWNRREDEEPTGRQIGQIDRLFAQVSSDPDSPYYQHRPRRDLADLNDVQSADYLEKLTAEADRLSMNKARLRTEIDPHDDETAAAVLADKTYDKHFHPVLGRAQQLHREGFGPAAALYGATFDPVCKSDGTEDLGELSKAMRRAEEKDKANGTLPPTDAQLASIAALRGRLADLGVSDYNTSVPASRDTAKELIAELSAARRASHDATKAIPTEDGLYVTPDGAAVRVRGGKAQERDLHGGWKDVTNDLRKAGGARLRGATPMTEADAREIGKAHGVCMVCSRPLSGKSAETGIGPKCRVKLAGGAP